MIEWVLQADQKFMLALNGLHHPYSDILWSNVSKTLSWLPLFAWLFYLIIKHYGRASWKILILVALLITASDQTCNLAKNNFKRYRPCHHLSLQDKVHVVGASCGGQYGFYSAHASNAFAIGVFLILLLRRKNKYVWRILLGYAISVSLSRIFLGVHYPLDVIAGAINGTLLAASCFVLFSRIHNKTAEA